jgi:chromate transporter
VLPSLVILVALSWVYVSYGDLPLVAGVLYGIKPAVTAIVLHAAWRIGSRTLRNPLLWAIAAAAFVAIALLDVPFPVIVLGAAVIGWVGGRLWPDRFMAAAGHGSGHGDDRPAIIDDDRPTPEHARLSTPSLLGVAAVGLAVWAGTIGALAAVTGRDGTLAQMGWFFTKAGLLTFGGAYAVLPYVFQGAVEQYDWVTAAQMIDGLALGETTPGPLIMVVAFVGFLGGWNSTLFGPDQLFLAGLAAAVVVTWFTFLPSFIFIFVGGPVVETTHRQPQVTAPLTAITAAVVGVIVNLAVFFAYHVLWPDGLSGPFERASLVIGLAAAVALFRFGTGVIPTLLACGAAGPIYQFV